MCHCNACMDFAATVTVSLVVCIFIYADNPAGAPPRVALSA